MNQNELNEIGYRKINHDPDGDDYVRCHSCIHYDRQEKYSSDYYCIKHRMTIEPFEHICDDYYDLMETPEGKKAAAIWNQMAANSEKTESRDSNEMPKTQNEGCYIATAVYGGYDQPEVMVLRRYRDEVLKKSVFGQIFIKVYYALSPSMAEKLKYSSKINDKVRKMLDIIVKRISNKNM